MPNKVGSAHEFGRSCAFTRPRARPRGTVPIPAGTMTIPAVKAPVPAGAMTIPPASVPVPAGKMTVPAVTVPIAQVQGRYLQVQSL